MAKGFSIMDMMSDISREEAAEGAESIEKVSVFDIQPNEDNFYGISSIEQLKNSIFSMGGVQQNLLLVRLPAGGDTNIKLWQVTDVYMHVSNWYRKDTGNLSMSRR